ncbi:PREDICTED: 28S ribosomal protein S6, mitochondrial [Dipodomys ordii]|uniref:Small ribosomal subunit protein bS6m n=1 Tax=Dipodomys ordii TaxID=10020 RepID=A0A1S3G248_DIPOR|nr:PREDICTED: 28S ribosomal protein S6, mitochondrial [Dipodomys ordii]
MESSRGWRALGRKRGGGGGPRGVASRGGVAPTAQLPEPLSPGSRGRSVLSPPPGSRPLQPPVRSHPSLPSQPRARTRVPAPSHRGTQSASEPRAERSGMPRYELALILKAMQRPESAAALKRTVEALLDRGAIVRNLENLGEKALPFKMSAHSQQHKRGGYFLVDFYAPTTSVDTILEHLSRDTDVIRPTIVKHPLTQEVKECEGIVPVPLEEKLYSAKKRKK